jgi:heme/copper-type cytochrome/quinol oxidase subunit 4
MAHHYKSIATDMNGGCLHSVLQAMILGPLFAIGLTIVGGWRFLINGFWDTDWVAIPFWAGLSVMNQFLVFLIYPILILLGSLIFRRLLGPTRKLLHFLAGLVMGLVIYGALWGLYRYSDGYLMLGLEVYAFPEVKYAPVFMLTGGLYFWFMAFSQSKSSLNHS